MTSTRAGSVSIVLAALAVGSLLAFAGCGDSEGSDETQSREAFIAAADEICAEAGAEIDSAVQERVPPQSDPKTEDFIAVFEQVVLPALARQYDEIGALPPPDGSEAEAQEIIDEVGKAIAESEADPELLLVAAGSSTPFDEANELQQQFGFQVCGAAGSG